MTTIHLIHHLLILLAHSPHARHIWTAYFRREMPGMPHGYYYHYAHDMIMDYPRQMLRILHHQPSDL